MTKTLSVSAIVCAYNEAKTILPILKILLAHPKVNQVLVVDDGSTDSTWKQITSLTHAKLTPLRHPRNRGKGAAVATAAKHARSDILLFVDADLKNFHSVHIDLLLAPLDVDPHCMTIGLRKPQFPHEKLFSSLIKTFNGERAFSKKSILTLLPRIKKSGYGVEAIINLHFIRRRKPIYYIPLPNLVHITKGEKHPIYKFLADYLNEFAEVSKQLISPENKALKTLFQRITETLGV